MGRGLGDDSQVPGPWLSAKEGSEEAFFQRAEWKCQLFPIESTDGDVNLSSVSDQQLVVTPGSDDKPGFPPYPYLALLPSEIIENILSSLDNRAIKNLRLTCRRFDAITALRINRVFLSANPLNIQVFRAIADHDVLRHRVVEIIYDDARLWRSSADAFDAHETREPKTRSFHPT